MKALRRSIPDGWDKPRDDFAFVQHPHVFAANSLYLEIIRFAYNLVTSFQRICLPDDWQGFTLRTLRYKLFCRPARSFALTIDRFSGSHRTPQIKELTHHILAGLRSFGL